MRNMKFILCCLGLMGFASQSDAAFVTYSGSKTFGSDTLSASVTFETSGSNLIVTLTNTADAPSVKLVPEALLTAVLFNYNGGALSLTPASAIVGPSSKVTKNQSDISGSGTVVGGEWAYKSDLNISKNSVTIKNGISSSGLGAADFGHPNFPGSNLSGPDALDGDQYGIAPLGTYAVNGGADTEVIKNSVVFTLSGLPADFDLSKIGNVVFQYGTDISETSFSGTSSSTVTTQGVSTPAPPAILLLGLGGMLMGLPQLRNRFRNRVTAA